MSTPITRVPAVLEKLVEVATAALADVEPAVVVMDGPRLGELPWRHLMLGITDSPDTAPYSTHYTRQDGLGRPRYVEEWTVRCGLCLADGGDDLAGLRAEAAELLGLLDAALGDAHVTEGVWDDVGLGEADMQWYAVPNKAGSTVLVYFSIEGSSLL